MPWLHALFFGLKSAVMAIVIMAMVRIGRKVLHRWFLVLIAAAAFAGIVLPVLLDRFNIDPALASGPFVTTVTDVVGFFAFLGLASTVLL
jgi:magnesium transporter